MRTAHRTGGPSGSRRFATHGVVDPRTDLAALSSIGAQIDDLAERVTEMADGYGETPDSSVTTELYAAERALLGARRALERASGYMEQMTARG